jgi:short-subunit dehydrogenase
MRKKPVDRTAKLEGVRVIVTGASRGIGRSLVQRLAINGACVGGLARSSSELDELKTWLSNKDASGRLVTRVADVADREQLLSALQELIDELGGLDVLVNNAGVGCYGPVSDMSFAECERIMQVNYMGTVHAIKAVLPVMISQGHGHVVNVASIAGRIGAPFEAVYSASKFAVIGFSEAIALELEPLGIRVSLVDPGPVDTSFFEARGHPYPRKFPRPVSPEKVVDSIMACLGNPGKERFVPATLGAVMPLRFLFPGIFRFAMRLSFARELNKQELNKPSNFIEPKKAESTL